MYFRVLGPVEIWQGDRRVPAGPLKEQCILAILLMESGLTISAQTVADRLWDGDPPAAERETLQAYISRLRSRLRKAGDSVGLIRTSQAGGYVLDAPADLIDVRRFDHAVSRARATTASDPEAAIALFREAETLWSGEPLAGLTGQWADVTRRALRERHRSALLSRIELELRLDGRDLDDLVSELTILTAVGSVDEKAVGLLMRALARAGRLADALTAFRAAHTRLRDELGADPGLELRELHRKVLKGEPLSAPAKRLIVDEASSHSAVQRTSPLPHNLDRDPGILVGRDSELSTLLTTVRADLAGDTKVSLYALDGMPGIGKTSLALRAAHLLRDDCPDGQIQLSEDPPS